MDSIERGQRAATILDDPLYKESFEVVTEALMEQWKNSNKPSEREAIHSLWYGLQQSKGVLESYMESGSYEREMKKAIKGQVKHG